jgi:membrane protein YdbS with pleckstrin-like domain
MTEQPIDWTPLDPGQLRAMRIGGAIRGVILLAIIAGLGWFAWDAIDPDYSAMLIPVLALLVFGNIWLNVIAPPRRFRRWGYARQADELLVRHGVLTHTETCVAFHRVQHIDVAQGPVERLCGVMRLVLNTAGTMNSRITLPGLPRDTAEALRDEIRVHIRADSA